MRDLAHAEVARDIGELRDIVAAERRIAAGRYGICIDCDTPINYKRLVAYPTAKRCRPCQEIRAKTRDQLFHRQMYDAAGVPDLWELVRRQSGHIDRLRRLHLPTPGKGADIVREHTRIVDAIARGDPAFAERRLREHMSGTMSRVATIRASHPEYVNP